MEQNKESIHNWLYGSARGLPSLNEETVIGLSKQIREHLDQIDAREVSFEPDESKLKEMVLFAKRQFLKNEIDRNDSI